MRLRKVVILFLLLYTCILFAPVLVNAAYAPNTDSSRTDYSNLITPDPKIHLYTIDPAVKKIDE